jgi:aldehyde dehydrogenase (NAD+)
MVNGEREKVKPFMQIKIHITEETLVEIRLASVEDIDEAYRSAQKAQQEWKQVNAYQKVAIMKKAIELVKERREELVKILVEENGPYKSEY